MNLLGFDTSTPLSSACVLRGDGREFELVPDPAGLLSAPAHARELMPAVDAVLARAGLRFGELQAIAVGVGPGGFTGLRIGIATARALARAQGLPLRPVSSLRALAEGIGGPSRLPLIGAGRGEVFAALYEQGVERLPPFVARPEEVAERVRGEGLAARAAGEGSIRFRGVLEAAGIQVDADASRAHVVRALHVCRLAADVAPLPPEAVLPEYLRAPDATHR